MNILIVEDDNEINQLLFELLSPHYTITQAYSGTEALRLIESDSFDCVLLDLMLPGLSGAEVIQQARLLTTSPFIIISALSDVSNRVNLLELGADDYITKPFDNREVLARVQVQLRKRSPKEVLPEVIRVNNVTYHEASRTFFCDDAPLTLTLKEQELLVFMMRAPNRVFTKATLYEQIWEDTYYGDDNTLSVHISRLRKTLADHNAKISIDTIWGLGYKLSI
ncbi:hypothetical protein AOC36_00835 [Erysipelothrix larvae]|uniref:XRE family transcriptional regulator n=1 Tax=Erysipelothrix larvae TaxID=1514105 RepID=A0A0X8GY66_9FIRM|nr:response regulator transcription factor [Erysipelothrix larvae]AMC92588.1 hypothetical protein AOC36_00835 [Erysipelothrix larvae]